MALKRILIHPDPRLKKVCAPVAEIDDGLRGLIRDMYETMYEAPGIGLAAPQIGLDARVIVMDCAAPDEEKQPLTVINPEILWTSEETNVHEEGCLSIPEVFAHVTRPAKVGVRFMNEAGETEERDFDTLQATCIQHEIDHLNGKLFIDYLGAARRMLITEKMRKLKRKRAKAAAE